VKHALLKPNASFSEGLPFQRSRKAGSYASRTRMTSKLHIARGVHKYMARAINDSFKNGRPKESRSSERRRFNFPHPVCPSVQQGRALCCTLSSVLFSLNLDDKLMSTVPFPIQGYFIVPQGHAIFSVPSSPGSRCREHEKISKGMGRW